MTQFRKQSTAPLNCDYISNTLREGMHKLVCQPVTFLHIVLDTYVFERIVYLE